MYSHPRSTPRGLRERGIEIGFLTEQPLWRNGDGTQHGSRHCDRLLYPPGGYREYTLTSGALRKAEALCPECWYDRQGSYHHQLRHSIDICAHLEESLKYAENLGVLGQGLPDLLTVLLPAAVCGETERWLRAVQDRARELLAETQEHLGSREVLMRIEHREAANLLRQISIDDRILIGKHITRIENEGVILECGAEEARRIGRMFAWSHAVADAPLQGEDDIQIETALRLYDPSSIELSELENCLRAARAL